MRLIDKNIIIGSYGQMFAELYIDLLINRCEIPSDDICFVALDNQISSQCNSVCGVPAYNFSDCSLDEFSECRSITTISLNPSNSSQLEQIITTTPKLIEKIYVHLTEDEVNRWVSTKKQYGELTITKKNYMSDACLRIIPKIENFIAAETPFREKLQHVLERDNFKIFDARDAFRSLPDNTWRLFSRLYEEDKKSSKPEQKILFGAKQGVFSIKYILGVFKELSSRGKLLDYKYMVFTYKKDKSVRIILDLYCIYMRNIKRKNIDISYPTASNAISYNALIMSCNHLILQYRGSMTTAKSYIALGCGTVHVERGSNNEIELCQNDGINAGIYSNTAELIDNITNNAIDIVDNKRLIEENYDYKYKVLNKIYRA
ncbi:hypothetical protein [Vibrio barjaei]|jgi:hypothetical protein|uniref:hypothetical protein n=1 Tax=Vibrio barjaei TaxID=1676683 RepID=UPI002283F232|nr:hypothetical protein [Vibrio barjaei]MCY9872509.1 hypothetical protein [Vibrio barjaei]